MSFSDVARNAGEKSPSIFAELTKRKLERNLTPVLVQTGQRNRLPRNMFLFGREVALQAGAMHLPEIVRHQHRQRLSHHFRARVAEDFFRGAIDEQDRAVFVDGDDSVGSRVGYDARALRKVVRLNLGAVKTGIVHCRCSNS